MTPIYTRFAKCFAIVTMFSCLLLTATTSSAQTWAPLGGAANTNYFNGAIYSVTLDGKGNLYTVGNFSDASGNLFVAHWNFNTSNSSTLFDEFGTGVPEFTTSHPYLQSVAINPVNSNITVAPGIAGVMEYVNGAWDTVGPTYALNNYPETWYNESNLGFKPIVLVGDTLNKRDYM